LKDVLTRLGMSDAFVAGKADLSGLTNPATREVVINQVTHLTRLQVFETGTRAAAVTVVDIVVTGSTPNPPKQFRADQPFHLALRETKSGSLLFIGRVAKPTIYKAS
jgi:serpin B